VNFANLFVDANGDPNLAEIGGAGALGTMLAGALYGMLWKGAMIPYQDFAIGAAAIIGAIGAAQRLRGDVEIYKIDRGKT
jgi:hypothetical protein